MPFSCQKGGMGVECGFRSEFHLLKRGGQTYTSVAGHLVEFSKTDATQTVQRLVPDCKSHFSLPKGGPKPNLHPRPSDHQNVPNMIANTPGKSMVPGRSFWKSTFWQGFPPCPLKHLPPQTECAGVLGYI